MGGREDIDGPGGVEGLERLRTPQSSFTFSRRARPPPIFLNQTRTETRVPLNPKLQPKESRSGLRGMFTRNKAEKIAVSPVGVDSIPSAASWHLAKISDGESSMEGIFLDRKAESMPANTPTTPSTPIAKASRLNLRSRANKQTNRSTPKLDTKQPPTRPPRTSAAWDPPPLFQAYPQAIKHAHLTASTLSADAILRMSNPGRNSATTEFTPVNGDGNGQDENTTAKKSEKAKHKHRRQVSGSISKTVWTEKIFVLVTSGYLLQYSGEGSFDRLPEKMMQLGKDSVAFASDAIPGRHWVLQVSQSVPTSDSRSLLSRLTLRGADYRRSATNFLLVLDSAEDMDSWIAVVRREIESLGGKKQVSETGRPKADTKVMQLRAQPSHRYLVQQESQEPQNPVEPPSPVKSTHDLPLTVDRAYSLQADIHGISSAVPWPQPAIRPSTGYQSRTDSVISHDGRHPDELRGSSNRFSYMSSGQRTLVTSHCSTPEPSPTRDSISTAFEDHTPKISIDESRPRPNAAAIHERRRSMQTVPIPILEHQFVPKTLRHSTYGPVAPTPNFSVPNTSSRRYSVIKANSKEPSSLTTSPNRTTDRILKGSRKGPPPAISINPPLSPVKDSPRPRSVPVYSPSESSFKIVQQIKSSVVDIPPRSPLDSPVEINSPQRRSSLQLRPSPGPSPLNFQFPLPDAYSDPVTLKEATGDETHELAQSTVACPADLHLEEPAASHEKYQNSDEQVTAQISSFSNTTGTRAKLRRPISMQIQPFNAPVDSVTVTQIPLKPYPSRLSEVNMPLPSSLGDKVSKFPGYMPVPPALRSLRLESNASNVLTNRRSMPVIMGGPPPAPPPDCALPPLPPHRGGSVARSRMRSSIRS